MSRRKEANRAEAIVRGIGAIIMVLALAFVTFVAPGFLKGKNTDDMMSTALHIIIGFAVFSCVITVIGLIVWFKVLKGKNKRGSSTKLRY